MGVRTGRLYILGKVPGGVGIWTQFVGTFVAWPSPGPGGNSPKPATRPKLLRQRPAQGLAAWFLFSTRGSGSRSEDK
jgi:hypothetical protein